MLCTPVWRLGLSYAARERGLNAVKPLTCRDSRLSYAARSSGLERFDYAVHPSLATGAILCRPRARAECRQTAYLPRLTAILCRPLKRAGEVWSCCAPQSGDWGYPMPPASAG